MIDGDVSARRDGRVSGAARDAHAHRGGAGRRGRGHARARRAAGHARGPRAHRRHLRHGRRAQDLQRLHRWRPSSRRQRGRSVAKHGNRSRTGRGSAEVLDALGIRVDAPLRRAGRLPRRGGHLLLLRQSATTRPCATWRPCARRWLSHHLQRARTAHQPGRRQAPGAGRVRRALPRAGRARPARRSARARRWWCTPTTGSTSCPSPAGSQLMQVTQAGIVRSRVVPEELGLDACTARGGGGSTTWPTPCRLARDHPRGRRARRAARYAVLMSAGAALFVDDKVAQHRRGRARRPARPSTAAPRSAKLAAWAKASQG